MTTANRYRWTWVGGAAVCTVVFFAQGFFGNREKSLTWDEPLYIASGYTYLTRCRAAHPPNLLVNVLQYLPLPFGELPTHERVSLEWVMTPRAGRRMRRPPATGDCSRSLTG